MHPTQAKLIQLAQQLSSVAIQAATAYNQAQASLKVEEVLTPARLTSPQGTQASIETLHQLSELTQRHKDMFNQFIAQSTEMMLAAMSEMPADLQEEAKAGLMKSLNWNLNMQSLQITDREDWIRIALQLCELIDGNRGEVQFEDGQFVFHTDELWDTFNACIAQLDDIAGRERQRFEERTARIDAAMRVIDQETKRPPNS